MGAVYWIGGDGNIYYGGGTGGGVQNMGKPIAAAGTNTANGFDSMNGSFEATQIADPLAKAALPPGYDSTGGSKYVDTTAARNETQGQLDSLNPRLENMNASSKQALDSLLSTYGQEDTLNNQKLTDQKTTNEQQHSANINGALTSAAQGRQGLRSTLSSLNALNGTGSLLADRAVASAANKDVGGANDTFDTNAKSLNDAGNTLDLEQRRRQDQAKTDYQNALTKNAGKIAGDRQGLFKDMAGFFTQSGNDGEAANWLAKINGENPAVEAADNVQAPTFQPMSAAFSPQALSNYLAGSKSMAVQTQPTAPGTAFNTPLFATQQKKETPA